jgi:hypothetical protein
MNSTDYAAAMRQAGFELLRVHHLHFWPTRLLLAYVQWPKPITAAGFYLGKAIMALSGNRMFGDYQVYLARAS